MSTRLQVVTALSIAAVTITGVLAYSVHHGFTSAFIALPEESVRMLLIPIPSTVNRAILRVAKTRIGHEAFDLHLVDRAACHVSVRANHRQ